MQKEIDQEQQNPHKNNRGQQDRLKRLYKNFEETNLNDQLSNVERFKILASKAKEESVSSEETGESLMYEALAKKTENYLKIFDDVELTKKSVGPEYLEQMRNIEQQASDPEYIASLQKQHEDVLKMAESNQEFIAEETKAIFERVDREVLGRQQDDEQEIH